VPKGKKYLEMGIVASLSNPNLCFGTDRDLFTYQLVGDRSEQTTFMPARIGTSTSVEVPPFPDGPT
jgi:hypothetical protein